MNHIYLAWRLGAIDLPAFQRHQHDRHLRSLNPQTNVRFDLRKPASRLGDISAGAEIDPREQNATEIAHVAGVNSLAIDSNESSTLVSGGADGTIHLWSLSRPSIVNDTAINYPAASLARSAPNSHTHAITSLSIYPFDPTPTTLLSTSHDKSLKVTTIAPHSLQFVHNFHVETTPYTHHISPVPTSSPLIALATSKSFIPLLDLRSGLATHSLPGHSGSIYTLAWSPRHSHLLASGATDGRILFFDIRRATPAFASLDHDDAIGVIGEYDATTRTLTGARSPVLDWNARAHNHGAVTGLVWTDDGRNLVSAGHDQRIRIWDMATGRQELVHFGPRIRNDRVGELKPLISPTGRCGQPSRELLLWPNDDGKGNIFMHSLREGNIISILRTPGVSRHHSTGKTSSSRQQVAQLTSGGRINGLVWRWNAPGPHADAVEMYSAHGDGRIIAWSGKPAEDEEVEDLPLPDVRGDEAVEETERRKRRKKNLDVLGSLVDGLTRQKVTFS